MGYEPLIDPPAPIYPLDKARAADHERDTSTTARGDTVASIELSRRRPLRFAGLSLDTVTGVAQWRGKNVPLSEDELEVLQVLMHNAGRIVSAAQVALQLGERPEAVERRIRALRGTLQAAGA